jgi:hypothetical protein
MTGIYGDNWAWGTGAYLERNRWYCIETYAKMNSITGGVGNNDGILRGWVDGQLVFEKTDIRFRDVYDLKIECIWFNVYVGGSWSADWDMDAYFDNMVIAEDYVGPMTVMPGDLDNDGDVDLDDAGILVDQFTGPSPDWPAAHYESNGLVVIEAEHYSGKADGSGPASGTSWVDLTGSGSAGDGYQQAMPNAGLTINAPAIETSSPRLSYPVQFADSGTYYLHLKAWGDGGGDDSLHYGLDATATSSDINDAAAIARTGAFNWTSHCGDSSRPTVRVPSSGLHIVDLWMREDGVRIDRLLLTKSDVYDPALGEPSESLRHPTLSGDLDTDGDVDVADFALLAAKFGT